MVEISLYGSGEGPGWVTAPGYSTCDQALLVDWDWRVAMTPWNFVCRPAGAKPARPGV